uniref:Protein arginine N-methyltransferase domain-containing protein n=1 Tax=Amphimedon queenslandica TaxID=400682 RepID=A0A1X7UZ47_AMPQE
MNLLLILVCFQGLVGYFVIGFEVPSYPVYLSTSPQDTPTHWHQRIFFLNEPIQVQTGVYYVVVSLAIRTRIVQDHLISRYRLCYFHSQKNPKY